MYPTAQILASTLDVGEAMLVCGAEISRVEDTIDRICRAYGAQRADVFGITSSIVVTFTPATGDPVTQTRRIRAQSINLNRLELLNALSREICATKPAPDAIRASLASILRSPTYPHLVQCIIYALISGAFSVFFGGSITDACVSAFIGVVLKELLDLCARLNFNRVLSGALCAFAGGAAALVSIKLGLGDSFDKIAIGNVMLLIPGLVLTNALRDMLSGDTLSGLMRLIEAMLVAIAVALGFALAGGLV